MIKEINSSIAIELDLNIQDTLNKFSHALKNVYYELNALSLLCSNNSNLKKKYARQVAEDICIIYGIFNFLMANKYSDKIINNIGIFKKITDNNGTIIDVARVLFINNSMFIISEHELYNNKMINKLDSQEFINNFSKIGSDYLIMINDNNYDKKAENRQIDKCYVPFVEREIKNLSVATNNHDNNDDNNSIIRYQREYLKLFCDIHGIKYNI